MSLAVTSLECEVDSWGAGRAARRHERTERRQRERHTGRATSLGGDGEAAGDSRCGGGGRVLLEEFLVYVDCAEPLRVRYGKGGVGRG